MKNQLYLILTCLWSISTVCIAQKKDITDKTFRISQSDLLDKIKGGWAGQNIGVVFNKRIDPNVDTTLKVAMQVGTGVRDIDELKVQVDGHWLILKRGSWPQDSFTLLLTGVSDDVTTRLFKEFPANILAPNTRVDVLPLKR